MVTPPMATAATNPEVVIERRINEIEQALLTMEALKEEHAVLVGLRKQAKGGRYFIQKRPGPTEAVLAHVKTHPGQTPADIVGSLRKRIGTGSRDPARIIFQTIANLRSAGRLRIGDNRGVYLEGEG